MTPNSPSASGRRDDVSDRSEQQSLARTVGANLATFDLAGIAAAVAGGALILGGLRTARERRGRGLLQIVAGAGLLAVGYARRASTDVGRRDRGDAASADAHVELERPDTDSNPRDIPGEPEAAASSADEGGVQFTHDQTDDLDAPRDRDGTRDRDATRNRDGTAAHEGGDRGETTDRDAVEVDVSEAAVADEPGEAAGPTSAQAEPTTTKTDRSPPTDVEEPDVEEKLDTGSDGDGTDEETVETEGGAEVHTDAVESGTMDVDEDDVTDESGDPIDDPGVEELGDDESADYQAPDADEDIVDGEDGEDSEDAEETEAGTAVHTDTNESGTMDVDEDDVHGDEGVDDES